MKQIILATAVAMALSTTFAAAQSSQPQAGATAGSPGNAANGINGATDNRMPRDATTGSSLRATGGNAAAAGNNGNSMSGSNTITNPGNAGNIGSGR